MLHLLRRRARLLHEILAENRPFSRRRGWPNVISKYGLAAPILYLRNLCHSSPNLARNAALNECGSRRAFLRLSASQTETALPVG